MKTLAKILVGLLLLGGVLLVAAIVLAPRLFDPNDYKDQLAALVQKETGRELSLAGPIEISLFPWVGVRLGEARLGNAEGFGPEPFARIRGAQVRVKLMPLLSKTVMLDRIRIEGLTFNLARDARGRTNWDDLLKSRLPGAQPGSGSPPPASGGTSRQPAPLEISALTVGGLDIEDAQLFWDDRQNHSRYSLDDLDLTTGPIQSNQPIALTLAVALSSSRPALRGQLQLQGDLHADHRRARYRFPELTIRARAEGADLPGSGTAAVVKAQVDLNALTQSLEVNDLEIELADLATLRGDVQGRDIAALPRITASLEAAPVDLKLLARALGLELPVMADAEALGAVAASLSAEYHRDQLAIPKIKVIVDGSTLTGKAQIAGLAQPRITLSADLDRIDLDRYLPPRPASPATGPAPAGGGKNPARPRAAQASKAETAGTDADLPLDLLRAIQVDAALRIGQLTAAGLPMETVELNLQGRKGRFEIQPAALNLFAGRLNARAALDVSGAQARLELAPRLSALQAGPLLQALTGKDTLTGVADLTADLKAYGSNADTVVESLSGEAQFRLRDGAVKGINLAQLIRSAKAKLSGQAIAADIATETDFSELSGTFKIDNGVVRSEDLAAKSPLLRVSGRGTADLSGKRIEYRLITTLVGTLEGQGGEELADLKGIPIPISIEGAFDAPRYALDLEAALASRAKSEAHRQIEKQIDKNLGDKVTPEVGDALKKTLKKFIQ